MRAKIGEVFGRTGDKGTYDYDFGSTTRLTIERTGGAMAGSEDSPYDFSSALRGVGGLAVGTPGHSAPSRDVEAAHVCFRVLPTQ